METVTYDRANGKGIGEALYIPPRYHTINIDGLNIFYREAGDPAKPTLLLLHGFPASSFMFRNLMMALSHKYHLIAPDYPGFGHSSMPAATDFDYSFNHLAHVMHHWVEALGLKKYSLFVQDYGAPMGFRLATHMPERVQALFIQNGNAYLEGLSPVWDPIRAYWADPGNYENIQFMKTLFSLEATKDQYQTGARDLSLISPDNWIIDQALLDRPGNQAIQLALFYSYQTNLQLYPEWHTYFRTWQPPTLITWGMGDEIFPASGAYAYQKDLKNLELHLLDTGHFALEEEGGLIASLMDKFLERHGIR